jgi:hypothetical protein
LLKAFEGDGLRAPAIEMYCRRWFDNLVTRGFSVDITSPLVVVPVIVVVFFACIIWATRTNVQSHHSTEPKENL